MLEKLKEIFKRIFKKKKELLLCENNTVTEKNDARNDFLINLRQSAFNQNDENGYGIIENVKWENLI